MSVSLSFPQHGGPQSVVIKAFSSGKLDVIFRLDKSMIKPQNEQACYATAMIGTTEIRITHISP